MIDISKLVATIGDDVCQGLVEVGAFAGNGKLIALKIVKSDNDAKQEFTEVSQPWDLSEDLFRGIEKVTCSFYSSGANASDLNDHRYNPFFAKNGEIESHQLPSCKDCLQRTPCGQAIKRVFGGAVCSVAHVCTNPRPSWIQMEDGKPAPEAVLERLACRCPRSFTPQTAFAWRTS